MAAFPQKLILASMALVIAVSSTASATVVTCESVFQEQGPYQDEALEKALIKGLTERDVEGLSVDDITLLVEKVYESNEGKLYEASDYFHLSAKERVRATLARKVGEEITRRGIIEEFNRMGLILDSSRLVTTITKINRSGWFNILSASWGAMGIAKGRVPVFLPDIFLKIKPEDLQTLVLKGLDSKEGIEITNRYAIREELIRGYTLINRYYTHVTLAIMFIALYENSDFLKHKHEHLVNDLWDLFMGQLEKIKEDTL